MLLELSKTDLKTIIPLLSESDLKTKLQQLHDTAEMEFTTFSTATLHLVSELNRLTAKFDRRRTKRRVKK